MNFDITAPIETIKKMGDALLAQLPKIALAMLFFALFLLAGRLIRTWVSGMSFGQSKRHSLGLLLGRLAQTTVVVFGAFIACGIVFPSVGASTIIQVLGVSSVAIGFAFRDVLQNFLAGILILINEPFTIGDEIQFRDHKGKVEDILTRATYIRTLDGRRVVVPNAVLFNEPVVINDGKGPAAAPTHTAAAPAEAKSSPMPANSRLQTEL